MQITADNVAQVMALDDELKKLEDNAKVLLNQSQEFQDERKHTLVREGKEVEVTERNLWVEVYHLGANCEAGEILKKSYPDVFAAYERQNDKAEELKVYSVAEFGFDFKQLTIRDFLAFSSAIADFRIAEYFKNIKTA